MGRAFLVVAFALFFFSLPQHSKAEELALVTPPSASSIICSSLTGPCNALLETQTIRLAETVLIFNDLLIKQYVKEIKDDFYPDPKRKKKSSKASVFGSPTPMGIGMGMGMPGPLGTSDLGKFSDTEKFYEALALMNATGGLKRSLRDCIEMAKQYLNKRWNNPFEYLNDEHADPASAYYQTVVDSLPLNVSIYKQLTSKDARRKFIQHILLRDQTNFFEYICGSEKEQPNCPYQIRDAEHPFVCRHFSRYMFHKYRFNPMNYDNHLWDSHYHLKPVDEKLRMPIREVYVNYPSKSGDLAWHTINGVYLGDEAEPDTDSDIHNWYIFEPQTDGPMSLRVDEVVDTKYFLLKNSNTPILKNPHAGFDTCSGIEWWNAQTGITTKVNQECVHH